MDQQEVKSFNNLSLAEAERLAKLAEECGEIVQIVGKILIHGYDSCSPYDETKTTNRQLLRQELTDLGAVEHLMTTRNDIAPFAMSDLFKAFGRKMKYMHHQEAKPNEPDTTSEKI